MEEENISGNPHIQLVVHIGTSTVKLEDRTAIS